MTLAGKTAFISGASRGIGLAIAKRVTGPMAQIVALRDRSR
jgi:NAD(P)-dependent dehydrogenase (short-subunit alcohol dehydrogenase family)